MKAVVKTAGVVMACAVFWQPQPAAAINKEWSAALGFLGGVLLANAARCDSVTYERVYERPVVVERPVIIERPVVRREVIVERPPRGWWEYRERRVWVPGRWRYEGRHGCRRVWEEGYYRTELVRVWVTPGDEWDPCD